MPAKPRNNRVELRLTELEKKDWSEAAGGVRRLSEWIRAVCNARVAELADAAASSTAAERREGSTPSPSTDDSGEAPAARESRAVVIPNVKPVIVEDAIRRDVTGDKCPRWMHHRPGTYCGACKRVIAK